MPTCVAVSALTHLAIINPAERSCPHFASQRGRQRRCRQNMHARILLNLSLFNERVRISREEKHRTVPKCGGALSIFRKCEECALLCTSKTIIDTVSPNKPLFVCDNHCRVEKKEKEKKLCAAIQICCHSSTNEPQN